MEEKENNNYVKHKSKQTKFCESFIEYSRKRMCRVRSLEILPHRQIINKRKIVRNRYCENYCSGVGLYVCVWVRIRATIVLSICLLQVLLCRVHYKNYSSRLSIWHKRNDVIILAVENSAITFLSTLIHSHPISQASNVQKLQEKKIKFSIFLTTTWATLWALFSLL